MGIRMSPVQFGLIVVFGFGLVCGQTTATWSWDNLGPRKMLSASGAINVPLPHPSNANIIYAGAVNGGIWRTYNAMATGNNANWTALTDTAPSLSVASMAWDYSDPTFSTVIAGIGLRSSYYKKGGPNAGIIYSNSSFSTYRHSIGASVFGNNGVFGVAAVGSVFLACTSNGVYRSSDYGVAWTRTLTGNCWSLTQDLRNAGHFYVGMKRTPVSIARSTDYGVTWTEIANNVTICVTPANCGAVEQLVVSLHSTATHGTVVWFGAITANNLVGLGRGTLSGSTWSFTRFNGSCLTDSGQLISDLLAGDQGSYHFAFLADPKIPTVAYIAGDRGNSEWVCDSSIASGAICRQLSGSGSKSFTTIHADIRGYAMDVNDNLLAVSDGGIYRRTFPQPAVRKTGDWSPVTGDIVVTECFCGLRSVAFTYCGSQDNGNPNAPVSTGLWAPTAGDGSQLQYVSDPVANRYYIWRAYQFLGGWQRVTYNGAGSILSFDTPVIPLALLNATFYQEYFVSKFDAALVVIPQTYRRTILSTDIGKTWINLTDSFPVRSTDLTITHMVFGLVLGGVSNKWANIITAGSVVLRRDTQTGMYTQMPWPPTVLASCSARRIAANPDDGNFLAILCSDGRVVYTSDGGAAAGSWQLLPSIGGTDTAQIIVVPVRPYCPYGAIMASCATCGVKYYIPGYSTTWTTVAGFPKALPLDLRFDSQTDSITVATLGRGLWGIINPPLSPPAAPSLSPKAAPIASPVPAAAGVPRAAPVATPVAAPRVAPVSSPRSAPVAASSPAARLAPQTPPVAQEVCLDISVDSVGSIPESKQQSLQFFVVQWLGPYLQIDPTVLDVSFSNATDPVYVIKIDFLTLSNPQIDDLFSSEFARMDMLTNLNADLTSGTGEDNLYQLKASGASLANCFFATQAPPSPIPLGGPVSDGSPRPVGVGVPSESTPLSSPNEFNVAPDSTTAVTTILNLPLPVFAGIIAGAAALLIVITVATILIVRHFKKK